MDERYQIAEKKCVEKVVGAAMKDWSDMDPGLRSHIEKLLAVTVEVAFAYGYDTGYCNGVDDIRDVE